MFYRCESCGEELNRVIFDYDGLRDDLYLNCPNCGGNCVECEEDNWIYEEEDE